eukprot:COSAG05_NODE_612_length_8357_cov_40.832647_3_plen_336_part_00
MATTAKFWSKLRAASANKVLPRVVSSGQGAYLTIGGKDYLNFCSSHYLGFAEEPRLKRAAQDAIEKYGLGTGYRTLAGTHALHVELEDKIAHFKGTEAAVTFSSAYAANASAVQTILGKEDIVISDQLNHASIIDAVRVAGVQNKYAYAHSDMGDLEAKLIQASELQKTPKSNGENPLILIVTDGVFSMDGDLARLPQIVELAKKYDALTMVDDAHGEGVLGQGGRGVVNHFGLEGEVDIEIGRCAPSKLFPKYLKNSYRLRIAHCMDIKFVLLRFFVWDCRQSLEGILGHGRLHRRQAAAHRRLLDVRYHAPPSLHLSSMPLPYLWGNEVEYIH